MPVRTTLIIAAAVSIIGGSCPAFAAQPTVASVDLTNFKFTPSAVQLSAGVPTILQLRNDSSSGHSFSAPAFFAAARLDPASAGLVQDGRVEVPAHATVQLALTPAAGQYPLKCTHPLHAAFGMKGTIVVQ